MLTSYNIRTLGTDFNIDYTDKLWHCLFCQYVPEQTRGSWSTLHETSPPQTTRQTLWTFTLPPSTASACTPTTLSARARPAKNSPSAQRKRVSLTLFFILFYFFSTSYLESSVAAAVVALVLPSTGASTVDSCSMHFSTEPDGPPMEVILQPVTSQSIRVTWKVRKWAKHCPYVARCLSDISFSCLCCAKIFFYLFIWHSS